MYLFGRQPDLWKFRKKHLQNSKILFAKQLGLMIGVDTKYEIKGLLRELLKNGMLATQAGKNTLRLTPPLNISNAEIDEAVEKIGNVLKDNDKLTEYKS